MLVYDCFSAYIGQTVGHGELQPWQERYATASLRPAPRASGFRQEASLTGNLWKKDCTSAIGACAANLAAGACATTPANKPTRSRRSPRPTTSATPMALPS